MDSGDKSDGSPQGDESLRTQLRPMAYHLQDPFSIVLIPFWRGHLNLCTPFLPCPFLKQKVTTSQRLPASFLLGASQKPPGAVCLRLGHLPNSQIICHLLTFLPSGLLGHIHALPGLTLNVEPRGKDGEWWFLGMWPCSL